MRMTPQLECVLRFFLEEPGARRYGYEVMKATQLASGTVYPLFARLQDSGLVVSAWETPADEGQRPRRYYQLTGEGVQVARLELAHLTQKRHSGAPGTARPAAGTAG
ncbi:PadR family transcriptional regulator [Streptomyces sp. NPDC051183]|uniref:PadR family transcriptional regulator n=1 Tax=Streptomyces sp. NPDC051183 TaxID=3155165 RepID=UPI00343E1E4F